MSSIYGPEIPNNLPGNWLVDCTNILEKKTTSKYLHRNRCCYCDDKFIVFECTVQFNVGSYFNVVYHRVISNKNRLKVMLFKTPLMNCEIENR